MKVSHLAMHLSRVHITNFRGISSLSIDFHHGVNVLIGENRTCKTAILDALRLCLGISLERRDLYVQVEDFHVQPDGTQATTIELELCFANASVQQQGMFVEMLTIPDSGPPIISLHVRFTRDGDRIRRTLWGGANEGQEVSLVLLELLYFTHLGALRDAARDLSPSRANRLSQLFLKLVPEEERRVELAKAISDQVKGVDRWNQLMDTANTKIQSHLDEMVLSGDSSQVSIEFVDATFRDIAEGLRVRMPRTNKMAAHPADPPGNPAPDSEHRFSVSQNSLGYNNLLYIATVLGDLLERRERQPSSYTALLIEEPEAHLHPHWQNTLFAYLRAIEQKGVQVFITSHSPTITAKTDLNALIALGRDGETLSATPIRRLALDGTQKRQLQRFLDVTKSQLFFARAVLLVEGLSEALLMPTFADAMGDEYDLDKHAVEIVNVDGVAFEPFAKLFNHAESALRLNARCALVTDDDRSSDAESSRAANALNLKGGQLRPFLAAETFEFELYKANEALLVEQYKVLHPKTDLSFSGTLEERARQFVGKLKSNKDKAPFAQHIAFVLQNGEARKRLVVPDYIQHALNWVIKGDATPTD